MADATDYGLASYVYTRLGMCAQDGQRVDSGMTGVDVGVISNAHHRSATSSRSGTGREGGPEGPLEHPDVKYVKYAMFANSDSGAG